MEREYIIVCNEHRAIFQGCLLFWGHRTRDKESRSFGGYTSDIDKCEIYTLEEIEQEGYRFPVYNGENESDFKKLDDVIIKIDDLLAFDWLKTMRVVYRP